MADDPSPDEAVYMTEVEELRARLAAAEARAEKAEAQISEATLSAVLAIAEIEAELKAAREALRQIATWQREKCENASAEILFALLDTKIGIACAAYDALKREDDADRA